MTTSETLERASVAAPRPELDWEREQGTGRPRILPDPSWTPETAPPGWVVDGKILPEREYTRVTTFAEALQDSSALTRWKMRRAVLGMGRRPDYVVTAASLTAEDRDRDALDDLAEKALEASGPNAADVGTALHAFTDRIDRGEELGQVPEQYVPTLDAYRHVSSVLTMVEWECRTVCDELETAGTPDRLGFCSIPDPDGETDPLRIIDTKTGRVDYSAGKFSTQLGIYRRSRKYHPGTGARTSWEELHGQPVSRWGLVVHVPAGAGTAELLWIDLEHGDSGAQLAQQVRRWRTGAKAGLLLRPVFARPPRPATTDGTCRGRKQDGQPCGYKAKVKEEGLGAQFCGRHQAQADQLQRWLAENPTADPNDGVPVLPSMDPIQPSFPVVPTGAGRDSGDLAVLSAPETEEQQRNADAVLAQAQPFDRPAGVPPERPTTNELHADIYGTPAELQATPAQEQAYREGHLISSHAMPNGWLMAPVGALAVSPDGVRWLKVQRTDVYGWEREDRVAEAGGPELVRCQGTGLLVRECACSVHRPESVHAAGVLAAASDPGAAAFASAREIAQATQQEQTRPVRDLPPFTLPHEQMAAVARGDDPDAAEQEQLMEQAEHLRVLQEAAPLITLEEIQADLDGDDAYPDYGPADDAAAAMGLPSRTVGTYALDPDTEINGNPPARSGLQTPDDARAALRAARAGLFDLIDACTAETELQLLYQRHQSIWAPPHTEAAGRRSAAIRDERARARPEAALLSALQTAPDQATLSRLWASYGGGRLWTDEASTVAQRRYEQLQNLAQL